jgi:hypothetical protein
MEQLLGKGLMVAESANFLITPGVDRMKGATAAREAPARCGNRFGQDSKA